MEKRGFSDLCDIIARLRAPDGCPWDRKQTHVSLKKYMIEEAYEAVETMDTGGAKLADELGDVLLQAVLHAQIAKDEGEFDIDDVTEAICEKMVVRHPHIFGSANAETSAEVIDNWDEIKRRQRGQKTLADELGSISKALPALTLGKKIYKKVKKAGAEFPESPLPGRELFNEMARLVDKGLDPEEELRNYLADLVKNLKNF